MGEIAAPIAGSLIAARGARKAAQTQADAATRAAELQYEAAMPKNVQSIFGTFGYDDETKQATIGLAPELEKIYRDRLARSAEATQAISAYDPRTYQQQFYEEQQALAAPAEERQRLAMENRLRAQGLLGATTGGIQMQSLLESQATKDLARRAEARSAAQQEMNYLRSLEAGDITAATAIGGLGGELANIGTGIGSQLAGAAQYGSNLQMAAARNLSDAQAGFWSKIGSTIGQADFSNMMPSYGRGSAFGSPSLSPAMAQNYMDAGYSAADMEFINAGF